MGTSTDGILAYGFDLDGQDGWKVVQAQRSDANPYGYLKTSWYDDEAEEVVGEDGEELDVVELMLKRLCDAIEDAPPVEYKWDREDVVKTHYGVWFESHCSNEYPMQILATYAERARRGYPKPLDLAALEAQRQAEDWDGRLARVLAVLDITPLEPAGWLLASDWG